MPCQYLLYVVDDDKFTLSPNFRSVLYMFEVFCIKNDVYIIDILN